MKKLLILAPYPKGKAPSQRFRFEQYLTFLSKHMEVQMEAFIDEETWDKLYLPGQFGFKARKMLHSFWRRILLLSSIKKCDYLFIHREMSQVGPPFLEWIVAKILRKRFIYDFDDAIWIPNYSETNATFQRLKAYWKVRYIMRWAHHITAGNEYLADFARQYNPNVSVIPTTIDTNYHQAPLSKENSPPIIGWTGSHTTVHYLSALAPVLNKLSQTHVFEFRVISNLEPEFDLKNLNFIRWSKTREIADLSALDIGVMPLVEDQWSAGKCGFKALQYMSLGIATVLSPVGVNKSIVMDGKNGLFASTQEEWLYQLKSLLDDEQKRREMGEQAIQRIESNYSVNAYKNKYLSIIQS